MKTFNMNKVCSDHLIEVVSDACSSFEDYEPLFIYGHGGVVSRDYVHNILQMFSKNSETTFTKPPLPIVIFGSTEYFSHSLTEGPIFSYGKKYIEFMSGFRLPIINSGRLVDRLEIYPSHIVEFDILYSPSNRPFGYILHEPDTIIGDAIPIVYLMPNLIPFISPEEHHEVGREILDYLVRLAFHKLYPSFEKPTHTLDIKEPSKESVDMFVESLTEKVANEYDHLVMKLGDMKRQFLEISREVKEKSAMLNHSYNREDILKQLEMVSKMDQVIWCDIQNDTFQVLTKPLTIHKIVTANEETRKRVYDLGSILMVVNLKSGNVFFDNVTRKVHNSEYGSNHPHDINNTGTGGLCLGEISEFILPLVQNLELCALTELLINFAESVDPNDAAGQRVKSWPVIR